MPAPSDASEDPPATAGLSVAPVVSNTTPLITLGEIGLLDALGALYGSVLIPPSVFAEYDRGRATHPQRPDLRNLPWLTERPSPIDTLIPASLDAGERDAIALARETRASRILLDERDARAVATHLGLAVTGSVGALLASKDAGIISLVKPYLDLIIAQGRYISATLYERVMQQAGES